MKSILLLFLLVGCSKDPTYSWTFPDSSIEVEAGLCPNTPQSHYLTDIDNCGSCNHICPRQDNNQCLNGSCRCGLSPSCPRGFDCRYNTCIQSDRNGSICEFDHECTQTKHFCIEGHCTLIPCIPETCNGVDDDCDLKVDETNEGNPLSEYCFSGTQAQLVNPPCKEGYRFCVNGEWTECRNEVGPRDELGLLGCDLVDNDCDTCIDSTLVDGLCGARAVSNTFDVCFIIDTSGSMVEEQLAVYEASNRLATQWSMLDIRFCIILAPGTMDGKTEFFQDLTDLATFQAALTRVNTLRTYGGMEPAYDAIYQLGSGELTVSWRSDATRVLILFTDEEAQTYELIYDPLTMTSSMVGEEIMCQSLTHGEILAVATNRDFFYYWDLCAQQFELSEEGTTLTTDLLEIIQDPCL